MNNNLFADLNDKQIEAVKQTEGFVRIIAGAGSGKTRVLAHRYAFLVEKLGIDPANILCMTFTNKAAQEMKNRISKLVQIHNVNDLVCTIHGFCVKFLRKEIYRIGYPKNFVITDEEDSKAFAQQTMEELGLDR
ncbi:MAG: UvrD-helicase domain-containing protein, partial [Bacteroidales bacterium]|nr:UvrD-helicase domain-containing protein [Bacteroidales bacterium]